MSTDDTQGQAGRDFSEVFYDEEASGLPPLVLNEQAWADILPPEEDVVPVNVLELSSLRRRYVLDTNDPRSRKALDKEFKVVYKDCARNLGRLGLHREFRDVLGEMLTETRMVILPSSIEQAFRGNSEFYIVRQAHKNPGIDSAGSDTQPGTERLLLLNPHEVKKAASKLGNALNFLPFVENQRDVVRMMALEWVIGQKVMDLANTACFMRQEYGGFRPGFGGYTPMYLTRRTVALTYLANHKLNPEIFNNPDIETERLISGFGLHSLSNVLLRHHVVSSERDASWVVRAIVEAERSKLEEMKNANSLTEVQIGAAAPLSTEELSQRITDIFPTDKPAFSNDAMKELSDAVEW